MQSKIWKCKKAFSNSLIFFFILIFVFCIAIILIQFQQFFENGNSKKIRYQTFAMLSLLNKII